MRSRTFLWPSFAKGTSLGRTPSSISLHVTEACGSWKLPPGPFVARARCWCRQRAALGGRSSDCATRDVTKWFARRGMATEVAGGDAVCAGCDAVCAGCDSGCKACSRPPAGIGPAESEPPTGKA
eukprot:366226-Chlamydomonas_euryale.AAC.15